MVGGLNTRVILVGATKPELCIEWKNQGEDKPMRKFFKGSIFPFMELLLAAQFIRPARTNPPVEEGLPPGEGSSPGWAPPVLAAARVLDGSSAATRPSIRSV